MEEGEEEMASSGRSGSRKKGSSNSRGRSRSRKVA
jgi:hypothetical protein